MVRANFRFRFSDELHLTPMRQEFWLIPSMLWRGTNRYNYQNLRDKVDSLMSTVDINGYAGFFSVSIKTEPNYIADVVELLGHMLSQSTFDAQEFSIVKQREIDNYEEIKNDPQRLGFHELDRLKSPWPKEHILYVHTYEEIIHGLKELSLDRMKQAYYELFSTDYGSLAVIGNIAHSAIKEMLASKLTNMPAHKPFERIRRPFIKNIP